MNEFEASEYSWLVALNIKDGIQDYQLSVTASSMLLP